MEIFKDITGYEGLYQISNKGEVKSLSRLDSLNRVVKERILAKRITKGYNYVSLSKDGVSVNFRVSQLVATAFLNHKPDGMITVVDHIDNNKLNNKVENLQLITNRLNCSKDKAGLVGATFVKRRNRWQSQIRINSKQVYLGSFRTELEAHNTYKNKLATL